VPARYAGWTVVTAPTFHGKEGVVGSSPTEGFRELPAYAMFSRCGLIGWGLSMPRMEAFGSLVSDAGSRGRQCCRSGREPPAAGVVHEEESFVIERFFPPSAGHLAAFGDGHGCRRQTRALASRRSLIRSSGRSCATRIGANRTRPSTTDRLPSPGTSARTASPQAARFPAESGAVESWRTNQESPLVHWSRQHGDGRL
jgi:hypothetical protein